MGILGELWVKLGLKDEGLNKGLDRSKQKVSGFAKAMGKLGGVMAAAFSVKEIVAFTHRTAELANKAAGVRKAFEALNKPNLLADLRRATMGTVDDLQLMQRAVQAKNFKIPLDQLATYLQFATKRANETGQSVDYLVDSIITGLGRQSVLILDNLGISAAEIRDNMKDGASMAEAVGKIIKTQMGEAATEIDKAAMATGRLSAAWTNFQTAVGDEATKGPWNWLKGKAADKLEEMTLILGSKDLNTFSKYYAILSPLARMSGYTQSVVDREKKKAAEDAEKGRGAGQGGGAQEVEVKKPLIALLEEEIKAKEELRNLSVNEAEIRGLNNEIAALQDKLKVLKMTNAELLKYKNEQREEKYGTVTAVNAKVKTPSLWDAPSLLQSGGRASGTAFKKDMDAWKQRNEQIAAIALEQQQKIQEGAEMMSQALNSGITAGIGELANLIAGVEGANVGNVVKALLSPLADACISAGTMIMATGKAVEAFKASLKKLDGGAGIVGGAALIAIGLAAKAGLAAIGNNPTGANGYSSANSTSYSGGYGVNTGAYSMAGNNYSLTTTLKGQDILLAVQRTQQNNKR